MAQDNSKTPSMVLHELMIKLGSSPPDYNLIFQHSGTHKNRFDFEVSAGGIKATGSGTSKQIAKQKAAKEALDKLAEIGIYEPINLPASSSSSSNEAALDCIVELQTFCLDNKIPVPEFVEVSSVGPPHNREFWYKCTITSLNTEAKSGSKKMARRLAAKLMLEKLKDVFPELVECEQNLQQNNSEAKAKFLELKEKILPDKTYTQDYFHNSFTKIMGEKNLSINDFAEDLMNPTKDSLQKIADKLNIQFIVMLIQEEPITVSVKVLVDMPCVIFANGETYEKAEEKALRQLFKSLNFLSRVTIQN